MQFVDLVGSKSRIVEINPADGAVGTRLIAAGCPRYLAVTTNERRRDTLAKKYPAIASYVAVAGPSRVVRQNNAEVLILNGGSSLSVATYRAIRHANFVALPITLTPAFELAWQFGLLQCVLRRFALPRIASISGASGVSRMRVFRGRHPKPDL